MHVSNKEATDKRIKKPSKVAHNNKHIIQAKPRLGHCEQYEFPFMIFSRMVIRTNGGEKIRYTYREIQSVRNKLRVSW